MSCANDPRDAARVNVKPSHPDRRPTRMPLFATRTIHAGDEVLSLMCFDVHVFVVCIATRSIYAGEEVPC
jgi:hypothetical protein